MKQGATFLPHFLQLTDHATGDRESKRKPPTALDCLPRRNGGTVDKVVEARRREQQ